MAILFMFHDDEHIFRIAKHTFTDGKHTFPDTKHKLSACGQQFKSACLMFFMVFPFNQRV